MSNANKKKHLQPKKHRVQDALDFAKGYAMNVGSKNKALVQAQGHAKAATSDDTKNFWINIAGHIAKLAVFMMIATGCTKENPYSLTVGCFDKNNNLIEKFTTHQITFEAAKPNSNKRHSCVIRSEE